MAVEPVSGFKSRGGFKRLAAATSYSLNGLAAAWKNEASFRLEVVLGVLLVPIAAAPWWIGGTGAVYGVAAIALSLAFLALSLPVAFRSSVEGDRMKPEKRLFAFSILYLFALFAALVADRLIYGQGLLA